MVDFHTHHAAADALVSSDVAHFGRAECESLEFHPWQIREDFSALPAGFRELAGRAAAIGEIGLDRLRGAPLEVQMRALRELLQLAHELQKPVVYHAVRATSELLSLCRPYPEMPKLLHGFRGSPEKLALFRRKGFYVSLAPGALDYPPLAAALRREGLAGIGFESDDSPEPFSAIFRRAAERLGISENELDRITRQTFEEYLSI